MPLIEACAVCGLPGTGVFCHPILSPISSCDDCDVQPLVRRLERERGIATRYVVYGQVFSVRRTCGKITPNARVCTGVDAYCVAHFASLQKSGDVHVVVQFDDVMFRDKTSVGETVELCTSPLDGDAVLLRYQHLDPVVLSDVRRDALFLDSTHSKALQATITQVDAQHLTYASCSGELRISNPFVVKRVPVSQLARSTHTCRSCSSRTIAGFQGVHRQVTSSCHQGVWHRRRAVRARHYLRN